MGTRFEDPSQRKKTQDQSFDEHQRLEALIKALPMGVCFSEGTTCRKVTGNPAFLTQFEANPDDNLAALGVRFFQGGRQLEDSELPLQRAIRENRVISSMEVEVELPSGQRRLVETSSAPTHDRHGNVTGAVAVGMDITDRSNTGKELREMHEDLDRAQQVGQTGSWRLDVRGNTATWSDEGHRIFGVPKGTPLSYETFLEAVHPDDREYVDTRWKAGLRGEPYEVEHRIVVNGQVKWVRTKGYMESDTTGAVIGAFGITQDITAQKQTAEQLFAAHQRMQALMNALPVGVVFSDDPTCERINGNPAALAQFETSAEDNLSASAPDRFAPGRQLRFFLGGRPIGDAELPLQRAVRENRLISPMELQVKMPSGREWFVEASGAPIHDKEGNVTSGVAVTLDVTERKRAEETIKQQANLLHLAYDAIILWRLDGGIEMWSRGAETLYGLTEQEAIGRRTHELLKTVHPVPWSEIESILRESGTWEGELRHRTKDDRELIVAARKQLIIGSDGIARVLEINRDITEQKRIESELREAETLHRRFWRSNIIGMVVANEDRIIDANDAYLAMVGYSREDLREGKVRWPRMTPAEYRSADERAVQQVREKGSCAPYEKAHYHKDGHPVPIYIGAARLEQDPLKWICFVVDLTTRKQIEEERARQAEMKDEFLAVLGHELRNPLAAISAALQLLSGDVSPSRRTSLDGLIGRQVAILRRLVDDLLDLSRVTYGQIELKKEPADLTRVMESAVHSSREHILARDQELVVRLPSKQVRLMADAVRLEQVVTNLLNNASKYTHRGGRIELSGSVQGSRVVLRCKDNGRGIPLEMQSMIFEPFTRLGEVGEIGGASVSSGIGLALVNRLVDLHGGLISVHSEGPGKGSEFTVQLPLEEVPDGLRVPGNAPSAARRRRSLSIVVVEDNPELAQTITLAMEQAGHRVRHFPDGPSALSGMARLRPSAVLLDVGLPGMDGYELAAKLREKRNLRQTLFVGVSGFQRRPLKGKKCDDFDYYFVKPLDLDQLLELLDTHADSKESGVDKVRRTRKRATPLRALLIEDHIELADMTAEMMRQQELVVKIAHSGQEALEIVTEFRPQLVLCDLNLPDMSGRKVVQALRETPSTRESHIVILTGLRETDIQDYRIHANALSIDEFIAKPLSPAALRQLVAKVTQSGRE